jgi:hypothetical protein
MAGTLLLRGMLVGIVAGILCFGFLKIVGEPQVDRGMASESQLDEAKVQAKAQALIAKGLPAPKEEPELELVSRRVQAGIGLFTGVMVYNVAFGGLFALAFALAYGRMGDLGPRPQRPCWRLSVLSPSISFQTSNIRRTRRRSAIPTRSACARRCISP